VPHFWPVLPEVGILKSVPKPARDVLFSSPFQFAQIRYAPGLRHPRARSRNDPVKNSSHRESFDYKGLGPQTRCQRNF
jgi:hypothetical protein